jgi:nicotinamide phosphoribosyltransferase
MYQLHDFSMRGMSGYEDASRSSAGPLATGLVGTDTVGAIDYIEDYYGQGLEEDYLIGCSIPATEHAVTSSNILTRLAKLEAEFGTETGRDLRFEAEVDFIKEYITKTVPTGLCSYVLDTYAYWKMLSEGLTILKPEIMARDGKFVGRPDSGDPVDVICGIDIDNLDEAGSLEAAESWAEETLVDRVRSETDHGECGNGEAEGYFSYKGVVYEAKVEIEWNRHDKQYYYIDGSSLLSFKEAELTPEQKGSIQVLWEIFGGTVNEAGFKVLDSHIGLIYGDSITIERADKILEKLAKKGFASQNVVFGIGSYTYQMNSRDTFGTAMKATATGVNGELFEIYKDPATGDKLKKSAKGLLYVGKDETGEFFLVDQVDTEKEKTGELITRFKDGEFFNLDNIKTIRERLQIQG